MESLPSQFYSYTDEELKTLFLNDWEESLLNSQVFSQENQEKVVTKDNVEQILKAIKIDTLLTKEEVLLRLNAYKGQQAKFEVFYKDLVKLLDQAADEDLHDVISAYNTPAERIVKFLQTLNNKYSKDDPKLKPEIEYAISNINERKIFQPTSCQRQLTMHPKLSKQNSQIMEWLNEYSEVSQERSSFSSFGNSKLQGLQRQSSLSSSNSPNNKKPATTRRKSTIRHLLVEYNKHEDKLQDSGKRTFDIFKFTDQVGRENTFNLLSVHFILSHHIDVYINDKKFALFLDQIYKGYRRDVQYHNDLHGADVAHMANLLLTQGNLVSLADLDHIDVMAFLIGALCHDFGHDGYTNVYHVNRVTDRAIRYNDQSVQENYHVAESFAILCKDQTNFLEQLTADEFKVFRKRMIGCILATDMARHSSDLSTLKSLIETKGIKAGANAEKLINRENDATIFKSQQFILDTCIHACDVSQATRPFEIVKTWSYLLFEEFFNQGDLEKDQGLSVSFLCNRETTHIPSVQPGFINAITVPLWSLISEIMPEMQECLDAAKQNALIWEKYEETKEDKKVY